MDPRIQEFLARRLYEDTRDIQALGELRNDVDKLENYLRMYILQDVKSEKVSAENNTQENQASQDEKVDWTRMTQQYPDTSESATGRGRKGSTQMYTPMNQASQSKEVDWKRITQAARQIFESNEKGEKMSAEKYTQEKQASQDEKVDWTRMTQQWQDTSEPATGRGREWSTQMYTPMNQAYQSEDVGGNRMSLAAKHVLESMNQGKVRYAVTQMQSPMDQQTEVNRLLFSIFMLEQSYDEARKKHANCEEVQSKLDELKKLEKYLRNIKGADSQGLFEVKRRLKQISDHAKKISQAAEKTYVSAQIYTPMQQASQAKEVDWNRMTQVTQRASESDNSRNNPGGSMWRYVEDEMRPIPSEQEDIPAPNRRHNSPSSPTMRSWSSNYPHQEETRQVHAQMQSPMVQRVLNTGVNQNRVRNVIERRLRETGNSYPDAETLMNAVLNSEQIRGELQASSPHHQGPPHIPQTEERRNARRCSRSSHQEETRQAQGYMQSPMVQSVLNTGVDRDRVRNVIERRLRDRGNTYPNAEALMNAVLNYEQNREELNTSSSHHQGPSKNPQTEERRNTRRRSRSSTSSNAFPNAEVNAVMNSGQNPEVLNTPSSHDQKPPVIPQNAPQSYSPSTESRNSSSRNPDLEQMVNELRQKTKCKVCLDSELEVMFQPCNHLCCCRSCGFDERLKTCPVCRSPIENRVRTLIP